MKPSGSRPTLEDVLSAYAVEEDAGSSTLHRYLREFPEFTAELVDLSRELSRFIPQYDEPLSEGDAARISAAWEQHIATAPALVVNPFANLSPLELRAIAELLDVPRQILAAFRERRVVLASVPRRFLAKLASAIGSEVEQITAFFASVSEPKLVRSYKADTKPEVDPPVAFEKLLIDAEIPPEKRAILMAEDD